MAVVDVSTCTIVVATGAEGAELGATVAAIGGGSTLTTGRSAEAGATLLVVAGVAAAAPPSAAMARAATGAFLADGLTSTLGIFASSAVGDRFELALASAGTDG